jgi:hypothetical protein
MTKKHFEALADALAKVRPVGPEFGAVHRASCHCDL